MVEFAFVFPFLFLLLYGVIVYSYMFVLQESIDFAAHESAAAAVSVDPTTAGFESLVAQRVRNSAIAVLGWLPADQQARVLGSNGSKVQVTFCSAGTLGCPADSNGMIVKLIFDVSLTTPLFPVVSFGSFMGLGTVPPLPTQLTAQATVRI